MKRLAFLCLLVGSFTFEALANPQANPRDVTTYIPPKAYTYIYEIEDAKDYVFSEFPGDRTQYFPALIEHESCISLTHSRCWSPTSTLNTAREYGAGLGQLTKAYNEDGSIRFDKLEEMVRVHNQYLKELSWDNILTRPDLQIRTIILLTKDNYKRLEVNVKDPEELLAMTDSAYNGGLGGVNNDRRLCGLTPGCDPGKWWGNVELHSTKSRKALYAGRSAYDINRHHVVDVLRNRMPKYEFFYQFE